MYISASIHLFVFLCLCRGSLSKKHNQHASYQGVIFLLATEVHPKDEAAREHKLTLSTVEKNIHFHNRNPFRPGHKHDFFFLDLGGADGMICRSILRISKILETKLIRRKKSDQIKKKSNAVCHWHSLTWCIVALPQPTGRPGKPGGPIGPCRPALPRGPLFPWNRKSGQSLLRKCNIILISDTKVDVWRIYLS